MKDFKNRNQAAREPDDGINHTLWGWIDTAMLPVVTLLVFALSPDFALWEWRQRWIFGVSLFFYLLWALGISPVLRKRYFLRRK